MMAVQAFNSGGVPASHHTSNTTATIHSCT